jgi:hypothetical protein
VHRDLCGPVTPATPVRRRYFLLLVDDLSRYMWVVVLGSKGEAANAIRRAQAAATMAANSRQLNSRRTARMRVFSATTPRRTTRSRTTSLSGATRRL